MSVATSSSHRFVCVGMPSVHVTSVIGLTCFVVVTFRHIVPPSFRSCLSSDTDDFVSTSPSINFLVILGILSPDGVNKVTIIFVVFFFAGRFSGRVVSESATEISVSQLFPYGSITPHGNSRMFSLTSALTTSSLVVDSGGCPLTSFTSVMGLTYRVVIIFCAIVVPSFRFCSSSSVSVLGSISPSITL